LLQFVPQVVLHQSVAHVEDVIVALEHSRERPEADINCCAVSALPNNANISSAFCL
jgi:hypothetical protein